MSLNKVMLLGNVGRDPEVRNLESNRKVASFSLATTEYYKDAKTGERKDRTEWHAINVWDKGADLVEKFVKAGTPLFVEGRIRTRTYQAKDGSERRAFEIVADSIQLVGRKEDGQQAAGTPAQARNAAPVPKPQTEMFDEGKDDLPF